MQRSDRWPVRFVAVALLALVALPVVQERRIAEIEDEISGVLEPAGSLVERLALLQAREMAAFQAFLLTGDERFRGRYVTLEAREQEVYQELRGLVDATGLEVREPLATFYLRSQEWHLAHTAVVSGERSGTEYLGRLRQEHDRYEAVLDAVEALEAAIAAEIRDGRRRMDRAREAQIALTVVLAILALLATAAVARIGARLREAVETREARRQEAVRARREMQAVLEASGDGVLGLDLEGRCTTLNRTGSSLLGYTEVEARGRSAHELLHGPAPEGRTHPPEACPVRRALASGSVEEEKEDVLWRRDGTSFPASWHLRPLRDGKEIRGGVLTITDMTRVREAERALRRAVHARDEVVAVVSHDLRNPLGTVGAAAELLDELDLPAEKQAEQIRIIRRAARRMRRLIEDLLDVARIEAGGLSVSPRPVPPGPIVEEVAEMVRHRAARAGVRLETAVAPALPEVHADRDRLVQALGNLAGNAVKFTEAGGRVSLEAERADGGVRFRVRDDGPGIEPEAMERLFDRFWQAHEGGRTGAGLGLAIVKGITEAHGGTVEVESAPGEGSVFSFVVPAAVSPGSPSTPGGSTPRPS